MTHEIIKINPQIEKFLNVWSYWECRLREGVGDYPSPSAFLMSKVIPDFRTKEYQSRAPYINELAGRMNFIINHKLAAAKPKYAEALMIKYIAPRHERDLMLSKKNIQKPTFKYRVSEAKKWLSDWVEEDAFFQNLL